MTGTRPEIIDNMSMPQLNGSINDDQSNFYNILDVHMLK